MKKIIALAAVFVTVAALADNVKETIVIDNSAPVATNRFIDNWFVSVGAGVNTILDNGYLGLSGLATDITIGKWFTPSAGFRIGWQGLNNKAKDTSNGWFAGDDSFGFHFIHADFMWDILNTFRYNDKRLVSVVPMIRGGYILTQYNGNNYSEFGYGAAMQVGVRFSKRVRVNVEASATLAREEAWRKAGMIICFPSAIAGVQVNVGKTGFDRKMKVRTVTNTEIIVRDCGHQAQLDSLRKEIERLRASIKPEEPKTIEGWNTYFVIDKSNLLERERYHLIDLVTLLPEGTVLHIVGHADKETGSKRRNARLAEERVQTVYKALRELGFKGAIKTDSKGDTANPFDEPFPKNRCVTISVTLPNK